MKVHFFICLFLVMHFALSSDHCPFSLSSILPHSIDEDRKAMGESLTAVRGKGDDHVSFTCHLFLISIFLHGLTLFYWHIHQQDTNTFRQPGGEAKIFGIGVVFFMNWVAWDDVIDSFSWVYISGGEGNRLPFCALHGASGGALVLFFLVSSNRG